MAENTPQLKMLMDYTLFHIGAYMTLSTLLVSVLGLNVFENRMADLRYYLFGTLVSFMLAGLCGGIVASNLPFFETFSQFSKSNIGPFFAVKAWRSTYWMSAEHSFFWLGVVIALFGLIRAQAGKSDQRTTQQARPCLLWSDGPPTSEWV